ncbi:MAG TPA: 4Fe-4S binding protein, partial [Polyangiaceae bacterium]|nr:4Fe-4S binding protein [Polyangiaceae bacterium]
QLVGTGVSDLVPAGETLRLTRWETVQVDGGTFETTVEGVFAGGDVVTGAATVVEAVAAGRKAAYAMHQYLSTGRARPEPTGFLSRRSLFGKPTVEDIQAVERVPQRHMPLLAPEERKGTFAEVELGYGLEDVNKESARCLECGCAALFSCDLRDLASRYGADPAPFLGEVKQHRVDRSHPLIELDPAKCILCGRCIRICSEVVGVGAFGFVNRGFNTVVRPALGGSLLDTDCVSCGLCVGTCPTGAITPKLPLAKPGPWKTTRVESVCHHCGVGCALGFDAHEDTLVTPARLERGGHTLGNHCKKGLFGYDYVQAPDRALRARVRAGRELQETTLEDAIQYTGMRLKELAAGAEKGGVAVFVSPRMTNEEAYLAQKLARVALRTHAISSFANLLHPELLCPEVVSTASYDDLLGAQVIVLVGTRLEEERFAADLLVKRAIRSGARVVYVGSDRDYVCKIAEVHLVC